MPQVVRLDRQIRANGPLLDLYVGISDALRKKLWSQNIDAPKGVFATFLVDTGSDSTMVEEQIMLSLGISAINQREVLTSESKGLAQWCNVYAIGLEIPNGGFAPWKISTVVANGRHLMSESIQGVLGRDVLDQIVLTYNGPAGRYTIDYALAP